MLILVMANELLQFFIGWELMGLCSYLLISFDFEKVEAAGAGVKAFMTTRIGDLAFIWLFSSSLISSVPSTSHSCIKT